MNLLRCGLSALALLLCGAGAARAQAADPGAFYFGGALGPAFYERPGLVLDLPPYVEAFAGRGGLIAPWLFAEGVLNYSGARVSNRDISSNPAERSPLTDGPFNFLGVDLRLFGRAVLGSSWLDLGGGLGYYFFNHPLSDEAADLSGGFGFDAEERVAGAPGYSLLARFGTPIGSGVRLQFGLRVFHSEPSITAVIRDRSTPASEERTAQVPFTAFQITCGITLLDDPSGVEGGEGR